LPLAGIARDDAELRHSRFRVVGPSWLPMVFSGKPDFARLESVS